MSHYIDELKRELDARQVKVIDQSRTIRDFEVQRSIAKSRLSTAMANWCVTNESIIKAKNQPHERQA